MCKSKQCPQRKRVKRTTYYCLKSKGHAGGCLFDDEAGLVPRA